jgi:hypothetical protein
MIELRNAKMSDHSVVKSMMRHFAKEYSQTDYGLAIDISGGGGVKFRKSDDINKYVTHLISSNEIKLILKNNTVVGYVGGEFDGIVKVIDTIFIKSFERKKGFSTDVYNLFKDIPTVMSISAWRVYQNIDFFKSVGFDSYAFNKSSTGTRGLLHIGSEVAFELLSHDCISNKFDKLNFMEEMKKHIVVTRLGVDTDWESSKNTLIPTIDSSYSQFSKETKMYEDLLELEVA